MVKRSSRINLVPGSRLFVAFLILVLAVAGCVPTPTVTPTVFPPATVTPVTPVTPATGSLGLFETPRDGPAPVLNAIHRATKAIDVEVYELTDTGVEDALIAAQQAGYPVRVILNQHFPTGGNLNTSAFQRLQSANIQVKWSNPAYTFTHEKAVIVDPGQSDQEVLIMTLNLGPSYLGEPDPQGESLNFGVVDSTATDVAQAEAIFNADWTEQSYTPPADTPLVISPINSRAVLLNEIRNATQSVHFFAQEFEDTQVVSAVVAAAQRGAEVKGLLAPNISGNLEPVQAVRNVGGQIRFLAQPYEHAKATLVDRGVVYIGSINYTATSMDENRELGILTRQSDIASQMETEFAKFWAQGTDTP